MSEKRPPLRARLHWYRLSAAEFALLTAMCEHCSDGSVIWASIPRLAAYSKLSERTVQSTIRGLCDRRILTQLAPANTAKRRPATYRLNEVALKEDPKMLPYRTHGQGTLPGVSRPSIPGEPIADRADDDLVQPLHQSLVQPLRQSGAKNLCDLVQLLHQSGAAIAPDSKASDSRALDDPAKLEISPRMAERYELERRDGLRRLTQKGLRDYNKYPLEEWETTPEPFTKGTA